MDARGLRACVYHKTIGGGKREDGTYDQTEENRNKHRYSAVASMNACAQCGDCGGTVESSGRAVAGDGLTSADGRDERPTTSWMRGGARVMRVSHSI